MWSLEPRLLSLSLSLSLAGGFLQRLPGRTFLPSRLLGELFFCLRWQFFSHTLTRFLFFLSFLSRPKKKKMQRRSKANYYSFLSRFALVWILFGFCSDVELGFFSVEVTVVRRGRRMAVQHHQNTSENAVSLTLFMEVVEGPSKGTTYRCEVRRAHVEMKSVCVRVSCLCALCVRRRWHTHTRTQSAPEGEGGEHSL